MKSKELNPNWLDRSHFPFESKTQTIDGNIVHYIDQGSGPTLLLLHGNTSWSFLYRHIIQQLSSNFRCIALDYPGFGLSTAKNSYTFKPQEHSAIVEQFADQLGLKDISIMVQDWGGPIGLGFAGRRPELIRSVIIGNTFAWPAQRSKGMSMFSKIFGSSIAKFLIKRYNVLVKWLIPAGISRKLSEDELAAYFGPFPTPESRLPTWVLPREILGSENYLTEVESNLKNLKDKPALMVWGLADGAFRSAELMLFLEYFHDNRVCILAKAKHFIQEDSPVEICGAIRKMLL